MNGKKTPDVEKIHPPIEIPSDTPDPKTKEEEKDLRKPTPTQELARVNSERADELNRTIEFHRDEVRKRDEEIANLQGIVSNEVSRQQQLAARVAKLEEITNAVGWLSLSANILTALGAILVSVAGAVPDLPDIAKHGLTWSGSALAFSGFVMMSLAFFFSRRAKS